MLEPTSCKTHWICGDKSQMMTNLLSEFMVQELKEVKKCSMTKSNLVQLMSECMTFIKAKLSCQPVKVKNVTLDKACHKKNAEMTCHI